MVSRIMLLTGNPDRIIHGVTLVPILTSVENPMLRKRNSAFLNSLFDLYSNALAVFSNETDFRGALLIDRR